MATACFASSHAGCVDVVTVVGHLSQVIAGESIEATGDWVVDRNHGQQFQSGEHPYRAATHAYRASKSISRRAL